MIDPIVIGQTKEYILKIEREQRDPKDQTKIIKEANSSPTIWLIGALSSIEMLQIDALNFKVDIVDDRAMVQRDNMAVIMKDVTIVKHGLKGFRNFGAAEFKTETVKFFDHDKELVHDDVIKVIHPSILAELADEIWASNHVSGEMIKN